jgi:GNAT superfamily N-acetyltransferase
MEPSWFPILHLLTVRSALSITEIAAELHQTHSAVHQTARAMEQHQLLLSRRDRRDERRRVLKLSSKGQRLVAQLQPVWKVIRSCAEELIAESGIDLLGALRKMEKSLDSRAYYERISESIPALRGPVAEIVDYRPAYKKWFRRLNLEWLEELLEVEPADERMLSDPNGQIIRRGGRILFALKRDEVVGTVALIRLDQHTVELAKMAVTARARGQGIGRALAEAALARAEEMGAATVVLHTVPKLEAACQLYESLGFSVDPAGEEEETGFERRTIRMVLELKGGRRSGTARARCSPGRRRNV